MVAAVSASASTVISPERVTSAQRESRMGQHGCVVWFTGLPASGKSTLAFGLEHHLHGEGISSVVLDGDLLRMGVNADLGFDVASRTEAVRRVAHICALMQQAGMVAIASMVSPIARDREFARGLIEANRFIEVYVDTPLAECERRDPKGHYQRARRGDLPNFTGVDAAYEPPPRPEHHVKEPTIAAISLAAIAADVIAMVRRVAK